MLHEEFLKKSNSSEEKSTDSVSKGTNSNEVARGVVQDHEVAGPSQRAGKVPIAKMICSPAP